MPRLLLILLVPLTAAAVPATQPKDALADELNAALKQAETDRVAGHLDAAVEHLASAAKRGIGSAGAVSDAGRTLTAGLVKSASAMDAKGRMTALQAAVVDAAVAVDFKPLLEAPLPEGFPAPGPVGKVVVKDYPAYREARVPMSDAEFGMNRAFDTLFRHIQARRIEMSAPVAMTFPTTKPAAVPVTKPAMTPAAKPGESPTMSFLYSAPTLGTPGRDGDVDVVDVPAMKVVSLGVRGLWSPSQADNARETLAAWLKDHPEYLRAGEDRTLGYNSPFVLPSRRYSEVQVPVRERE